MPARLPRQSRLTFAPAPSSSPETQKLAPSVQSRAASIVIEGHGRGPFGRNLYKTESGSDRASKRRRLAQSEDDELVFSRDSSAVQADRYVATTKSKPASSQSQILSFGLPTPAPSSQNGFKEAAPPGSSSSESDSDSELYARPAVSISASQRRRRRPDEPRLKENATDIFRQPITPSKLGSYTPKSRLKTPTRRRDPSQPRLSSDGTQSRVSDNQLNRVRNRTSSPIAVSSDEAQESSEASDSPIEAIGARRRTRQRARVQRESSTAMHHRASSSEEASSEDEIIPAAAKSRRARSPQNETTSDDDVVLVRSMRGRVQAVASQESSEEGIVAPSSKKRRSRMTTARARDSEGSSRDKSNLSEHRHTSSTPRTSRQEVYDHEVQDDLDDLQENEGLDSYIRGSGGKLSQRQERQKLLEQMKARRQGKSDAGPAVDEIGNEEDEDGFDQPTFANAAQDQDTYEADFVDDDEAIDESLVRSEMPVEFSADARQPLRERFRQVVDWMVNKKLHPAFPRDHPLYKLAFDRVDSEVAGCAGSAFTSGAWRPEFQRALEARPVLTEFADPIASIGPGCEACGRTSHPATYQVRFSGKAYDTSTLEALKDDHDAEESTSESDQGSDNQSRNGRGEILPPEHFTYHVGRHCKAKASVAHALRHWRWHLNDWVLEWLDAQGHLAPARVIEREGWSLKRRARYANGVIDDMEDSGTIAGLWREFKTQLEEASSGRVAAFGRYGNA